MLRAVQRASVGATRRAERGLARPLDEAMHA